LHHTLVIPSRLQLRVARRKRVRNLLQTKADSSGLKLFGTTTMKRQKRYYVYILASKSRVLYVGVTGFLFQRVLQHKAREKPCFTNHYHVDRLVYFESFRYINNAIARETEIKKWRREKKTRLIGEHNPTWKDLATGWGQPIPSFVVPNRPQPRREDG
jgi:putative endonuclease